jgi:hypothetical protein
MLRREPFNGGGCASGVFAVVIAIGVLVVLTVAVAAFVLAPRLVQRRLTYERAPDRPLPFGYRMAWLAIRTADTQRVIDVLGLTRVKAANWNSGLGTAYSEELGETHVFVAPPVEGWTFVIGLALPHPLGAAFHDKATPFLLELGGAFGEVQYYFSYPVIDFFAWARVIDGRLARAFAIGDEGVIWNKGKPSHKERAMGLKLFELRGIQGRRGDAGGELLLYPTEDHVIGLAAEWSLDPTRLDARRTEPGLGYVGLAPQRWRPERMRKAA